MQPVLPLLDQFLLLIGGQLAPFCWSRVGVMVASGVAALPIVILVGECEDTLIEGGEDRIDSLSCVRSFHVRSGYGGAGTMCAYAGAFRSAAAGQITPPPRHTCDVEIRVFRP